MWPEYTILATILFQFAASGVAAACPPEIPAMARRVASLRSLGEGFSPPCRTVPAGSLRIEIDSKLRRDLPLPPETHLEAMARLGLIEPPEPELYDRLLAFYGGQVLGFYEPDKNKMVVVKGGAAPAATAPLIWAHELAHAAQEARFGLPSRILALGHNADAQRAAAAAAEGDATLVMFILAGPGGVAGLPDPALFRAAQEQATGDFADIPRFFLEELLFPYAAGYRMMHGAFTRGGWPAVDRILAKPPKSTAELLHPNRPPPGPQVRDSTLPATPSGFEEVMTNTMGEWGLRQWLQRSIDPKEAEALAAGWDADRFRLIRHRTDPERWGLWWHVRLRSPRHRHELEAALRRLVPIHLKGLTGPGTVPEVEWNSGEAFLELRAGWPKATPPESPLPG